MHISQHVAIKTNEHNANPPSSMPFLPASIPRIRDERDSMKLGRHRGHQEEAEAGAMETLHL